MVTNPEGLKDVQPRIAMSLSDDPPPTYVTNDKYAEPPRLSPLQRATEVISVKPSNFLYISRINAPLRGSWLIDTSLSIPSSLLPPLAVGETESIRKNLSLTTTNGHLDADITIAPLRPESQNEQRRAILFVKSTSGRVTIRVHAEQTSRPAIHLTAVTSNATLNVHIPRSFRGPITIKMTNGRTHFSPFVQSQLTTLSEVNQMQRGFIGDWSEVGPSGTSEPSHSSEWLGDELVLETINNSINIHYDDEVVEIAKSSGGFFSRLFGV